MISIFRKNAFHKFVAGFAIVATLQFFVPLLNAAVSDRCCESQEMQCCQQEFPSRMVCCISATQEALDDSVSTQGMIFKVPKAPDAIPPTIFTSQLTLPASFPENIQSPRKSEGISGKSQLYKQLSTFLI